MGPLYKNKQMNNNSKTATTSNKKSKTNKQKQNPESSSMGAILVPAHGILSTVPT